jgi:hypothetical protein
MGEIVQWFRSPLNFLLLTFCVGAGRASFAVETNLKQKFCLRSRFASLSDRADDGAIVPLVSL